jgi:hypothetical protein
MIKQDFFMSMLRSVKYAPPLVPRFATTNDRLLEASRASVPLVDSRLHLSQGAYRA